MRRLLRPVFCAALFCLYPALVQAAAESEILGLFQRWQAAHGQRSGKALEGICAAPGLLWPRADARAHPLRQAGLLRPPSRLRAAHRRCAADRAGRPGRPLRGALRQAGTPRRTPAQLSGAAPGRARRAGRYLALRRRERRDHPLRRRPAVHPLARGRFAGTEADFAWVVAHAPNSAALCDEYEDCRCDLWSADARVRRSRWAVAPARCSASSATSTTAAASACNCCVPGGPAPGPSRRCWKSATASGCGCCRTSPPPGTMPRPSWCCTRPTRSSRAECW